MMMMMMIIIIRNSLYIITSDQPRTRDKTWTFGQICLLLMTETKESKHVQ